MFFESSIIYVILAVVLFFVAVGIFFIWLLITHPWWFLGVCVAAIAFWYFALNNSTIEINLNEEEF